jgi:hypothetical protein
MNQFLLATHAQDCAPSGCGPQARWLCCSLLTYRPGYASSLAPRQQAWGPAAECELISARTLSNQVELSPLFEDCHENFARVRRPITNTLELALSIKLEVLCLLYRYLLEGGDENSYSKMGK